MALLPHISIPSYPRGGGVWWGFRSPTPCNTTCALPQVSDIPIIQVFAEATALPAFPFIFARFDGVLGMGYPSQAIDGITPVFDRILSQQILKEDVFSVYYSRWVLWVAGAGTGEERVLLGTGVATTAVLGLRLGIGKEPWWGWRARAGMKGTGMWRVPGGVGEG